MQETLEFLSGIKDFPYINDPFTYGVYLSIILYVSCCSLMLIGLIIKKIRGFENQQVGVAIFVIYLIMAPFFSTFITLGVFEEFGPEEKMPIYMGVFFCFVFMVLPSVLTFIDSIVRFSDYKSKKKDKDSPVKVFNKLLWLIRLIVSFVVAIFATQFTENFLIAGFIGFVASLVVIPFKGKKIEAARADFLKDREKKVVDEDDLSDDNEQNNGFEEILIEQPWNSNSRPTRLDGTRKKIVIACAILALFLILRGVSQINNSINALKNFVPVQARVIDDYEFFEYQFQGQAYKEHAISICGGLCFGAGELVEILVDPKNPKDLRINLFVELWFDPIVNACFFIAVAAFPLSILRNMVRNRQRKTIKKYFRVDSLQELASGNYRVVVSGEFSDLKTKYKIISSLPAVIGRNYVAGSTILEAHIDEEDFGLELFWDRNDPSLSMSI